MEAVDHNRKLDVAMKAARETRGFLVADPMRGTKTHAALTTMLGYNDYRWARPLCQSASPQFYYEIGHDQKAPVTCARCLAGLAKRGIAA